MRVARPFSVYRRKDSGKFQLTISPSSGLSRAICAEWQRRGYDNFPPELARFRSPASMSAAEQGAVLLIQHLKKKAAQHAAPADDATIGEWVEQFIDDARSPRAARLRAKNRPYSPDTLELYAGIWRAHIEGDELVDKKIAQVSQSDIIEFMSNMTYKIRPWNKISRSPVCDI